MCHAQTEGSVDSYPIFGVTGTANFSKKSSAVFFAELVDEALSELREFAAETLKRRRSLSENNRMPW
jgi:hypothetical protein